MSRYATRAYVGTFVRQRLGSRPMNEWLRPGSSSSPWIRAAEFAPTSRMRTAVRPVESTVSVAVRNTVSPRVRARNFTRASLCPRFGSKLEGSDRYASVSRAWVAWSAGAAAADGRLVTVRNTTRPDALRTFAPRVMAGDGGTGSGRITTFLCRFSSASWRAADQVAQDRRLAENRRCAQRAPAGGGMKPMRAALTVGVVLEI